MRARVPWWAWWAAGFALAVVLGFFYAAQDYLSRAVEGLSPTPWKRLLRSRLLIWLLWAAIAPLIVLLGRHIRVEGRSTLGRIPLWVLAGLGFGALHSALYMLISHYAGWLVPPPPPEKPNVWFGIRWRVNDAMAANMLSFVLIALGYHAVQYAYAMQDQARREAQLAGRLAESELQILKMQLQPHFFFNTLHTISALMDDDVRAARRVLSRLGDLLRLSLDNMAAHEVSLREELEFLRHYVDIQQARFQERLRIDIDVDDGLLDARVPSLVLQPIVENAIRHGIEPRAAGGSVTIRAARSDAMLRLVVRDDGTGMPNGNGSRAREGVGLVNTRARLAHLYGDRQRLELRAADGGGVEVTIELPYVANGTHANRAVSTAV